MEQLRLYTFINFYLSDIQRGIQTAHIVHELFNKYPTDDYLIEKPGEYLREWSRNHKTIIVLNAGTDIEVGELVETIKPLTYPWTEFREDAGLGHARTGVGIILPERVFATKYVPANDDEPKNYTSEWQESEGHTNFDTYYETDEHFPFLQLMKSKRLA